MKTLFNNIRKTTSVICCLVLFTCLFPISGWGQTTVTLGGLAGGTCPFTPTATWTTPPTGLTFSNITRGSGVTCGTVAGAITGTGFTGTLANNITNSKWYTFSITSSSAVTFTLSQLNIISRVSTATGSPNISVQYSIGGSTPATVIGSFTPTGLAVTYTFTPATPISVGASQVLNIYIIPNALNASTTTCRVENGSTFVVTASSSSSAPTVTSSAATSLAATSAVLNGNVTSDGGATVTDRGFVYKTSAGATISDNKTAVSGTTGAYTLAPTLSVNTQYYFKAYAINSVGTTLSSPELSFYTLANAPSAPTVGTPTTSSLNVAITSGDGNTSATEYAIQETTSTNYVQANGSLGVSAVWQTAAVWSTKTVTGLSASTSYTFKAKARNGATTETAFGSTATATTNAPSAPSITSSAASSITTIAATLNGTVTSDNGATVTDKGFVYNTLTGVTISDNKTGVGSGTGVYSLTPTLSVNTHYYFKSYAINSVGTTLSSPVLSFYTLANAPSAPTVGTPTTSSLNVAITSGDGNPSSTEYAIQETTSGNYVQASGTLSATAVWQTAATWSTLTVTGLSSFTSYTFKAKARNGANTETSFSSTTTLSTIAVPTVTSSAATSLAAASATFNGNVTSDGGATISDRGFVYKTSTGVTITDNPTTVAGTTGAYTLSPTLSVNSQYYFKAYAINSAGTTLSSEQNFYTLANAPSAPTVNNATVNTLDVAITAGDGNPSNTVYAIQETTSGNYVQADGSLSATAVWQASSSWSTKTVTGLSQGTAYTYKVKARNGASTETAFSSTTTATTTTTPSVTSSAATSLAATSAILNGNVTSDGGVTISDRGFVYKTSTGVTITDNPTTVAGTTGAYTLTPAFSVNTHYYFKAYAINTVGTVLSTPELNFYTLANTPSSPTVNNPTVSTIDVAITNGDGNPGTTQYAIHEPVSGNYVQANGTLYTTVVWQTATTWGTITVTGLAPSTTYSFEVKAQNGASTSTAFGSSANGTTSAGSTSPILSSSDATTVTATSATLNGNVTADGGATVTDRGFVYKTSTGVTITDNKTTVAGTTGAYTLSPTLNVNTPYYFKAYAINSAGTTLSSPELSFYTLANAPSAPTVNNATVNTLDVAITSGDGNPGTTEYAIQETTSGNYVQAGGTLTGTAAWQTASAWGTKTVTGLSSFTSYTFKAKARNGANTETSFSSTTTASTIEAPTVSSSAATSLAAASATLNGNVTSDGASTITDRGFVYKTASGVLITDNKTTVSGTTGAYTLSSTLSVNTHYYFKAYAINSAGTTLSSEQNFYTLANIPSAPTVGTPTSSSLHVAITSGDGNPGTTEYAIQETTSGNYVQADGTLNTSAIWQTASAWSTITVTGLTYNTTYTFEVKARNGASTETAFGSTANGTTNAIAASVTSSAATSLATTSATLNGNVTSDGGATITDRGFVYKTSAGATITDNPTTVAGTTGAFTYSATLNVNTHYFFKAYATNSAGTTLSAPELSFYTLANVPSAPTVGTPTTSSLNVAITSGDGNPSSTEYAIQETSTGNYVQTGGTLSATAAWQTALTWSTKTVTGLTSNTTYTFKVKARNGASTETAFGSTTGGTTNAVPPSITTPTATSITDVSALLGATVTSNNGAALTERGTVYKTSSPVAITDNILAEGGTAVSVFSHSRTLSPQTHYYYAGYATNSGGTTLSSEGNFYTLSTAPTVQASSLSLTNPQQTTLDITIGAATFPGSGATKAGYVVIYSTGTPTLSSANGNAPAAGVGNIFSTTATSLPTAPSTGITITGLSTGTTYNILVVPYTWDGTNAATYSYLKASAQTTNGTTTDCTPTNVTSAAATATSSPSSTLTWANPLCYTEILIIASTVANSGTPSGDGSAYTANLAYGSGTALGNGFVVYKGSTSSQTVTGLAIGNTYYYKFFTRRGTTWSAGTEVSAAPTALYWRTDGTSGTWTTSSYWSSSPTSTGGSAWVSGSNAVFTANSTLTFATTTLGNVTVANGVTVTMTAGGTLSTTAARILDIGAGSTLTWTGQGWSTSASSVGFVKNGAGIWSIGAQSNALNATNFGFTLNAGAIIVSGNNSLGGTNCALTINGGEIQSTGTRAFANTITLGGNHVHSGTGNATYSGTVGLGAATRTITNSLTSGSRIFSGVISGTSGSGLTFDGSGAGQIYIGNTSNTFTGTITLNGGEVGFAAAGSYGNATNTIVVDGGRLSAVTTAGAASAYTLASTHAIQVGSSVNTSINNLSGGTLTYNGVISDKTGAVGTWTKQGNGIFVIGGASTYTGATSINNGTVQLGITNALPTGTILNIGQAASVNTGTFDLNSLNQTVAGINSTTGASVVTTNTITSSGSATLTLGGSGNYSYSDGTANNSGIISGAVNLAVSLSGSGTQTLGGVNTYTGTTSITGGTLFVNGSLASGSAVTVGSSGILAGSGTAAGTVSLTGTVSPGVSASNTATLNTGAFTFNANSIYKFEINNVAGAAGNANGWDKIISSGTITCSASPITIDLTSVGGSTGFSATTSYSWVIAHGTSIIGFNASNFTILTTHFAPSASTGTFSVTQTGSGSSYDINLVYTVHALAISNAGTPASSNLNNGQTGALLFGFSLTPSGGSTDFTAVNITTSGTATSSDISNFKLYQDVDLSGTVNGGDVLLLTIGSIANSLAFSGIASQTGFSSVRYYLLEADIAAGATGGRTFTASIASSSDLTANSNGSVYTNGTAAGNTMHIGTPSTTLNNTGSPSAGNVPKAASNFVVFGFQLTPTGVVDFSGVDISTSGSATSSDISNFRLYYDATGNGYDVGDVLLGTVSSLSSTLSFSSFASAQTGLIAARNYLLLADFASGAITGNTFTASIGRAADITLASGSNTGTAAGNTLTIDASSVGDFRSAATGNWSSVSTWQTYSAAGTWVTPASAPTTISFIGYDITILNSHTITADGAAAQYCKNLTVNTGGKLYATNITTGKFVNIYGDIRCDGTIGNGSTYDAIGFDIEGTSCTISGNGTFNASRIAKYTATNTTTALVFDMNITLRYGGSSSSLSSTSNIELYCNPSAVLNVTINTGKTLTCAGDGSATAGASVSLDGYTAGGAGASESGGSLTINGTLDIQQTGTGVSTLFLKTNNTTTPVTLTIGTTGTVNAPKLDCGASGTGGHTLTINNGGVLNITGEPTTFVTPSITNNTYTFNTGSIIKYSSASAQTVYTFGSTNQKNLTFSGAGTKTLGAVLTVTGTVQLDGGTFATGGNLTINTIGSLIHNGGLITGYTPTSLTNYTPPSGTTTLSSDLTLSGTLDLGNNTLDISSHTLNITGDFTTGTGVIKSSGNGSVDVSGTGSLTHSLKFDQSTPGTTNRLQNFTVNRVSSGSVTLGNTLEVTGTLTLTNGTLNTGGTLTLISDANGTARVADIPSSADISGSVKVQRYVPAVNRQYRLLSANTSSFTFSDLKDNIFVSGAGGVSNGFDATTSNGATIYTYHESTTGGRGWKAATNISNSLSPAQGALVYVRGDRTLPSPAWYSQNNSAYPSTGGFPAQNAVTLDFNGSINSGSISPTLSYTNTGVAADDGWNLVGNPYPSQISWSALTKSNVYGWYYTLDPSNGSFISDNGSNYIASGQAFFVHATGSSPSITFSESAKVTTAPVSYFKNEDPQIELMMVKDSFNSDKAWLSFNSASSKGFVGSEDALKLSNLSINFGFYVDSNYTLQRSSVPYPNATDTFILSAYAASGNYKIKWSAVSAALSSSKDVYLHDLFNNNLVNMRSNTSYSFTITSNAATKGNRFQLIITDPSLLPVTWLSFTGEKINSSDVLLTWKTASEKNNSHFVVERSTDNRAFAEIGLVNGNGNTTTNSSYSFTDKYAFASVSATNYYRLKQVDVNGSSENSIVISLNNFEVEGLVTLYPNPAHSLIKINPSSEFHGNINIEVFNSIGSKCISENVWVVRGNEIPLVVSELINGVYTIVITEQNTNIKTIKRFIKK